METVGFKIKQARLRKGLSQKNFGKLIGVSDRAVSKWETGLSKPSVENLFLISDVLNVPMEFFKSDDVKTFNNIELSTEMESITELYKIGRGPSSSHTIGPEKACLIFKDRNQDAERFKVILYGSLAKTGKGHGTDVVIKKTLAPKCCEIEFNTMEINLKHPNTMDIIAFKNDVIIDKAQVFSVGGGSISFDNSENQKPTATYLQTKFCEISEYCKEKSIRLWEYAREKENENFEEYMNRIWEVMKESIQKGLEDEGVLPGGLGVSKRAKFLFNNQHIDESVSLKVTRMVCSYAFAVGEQNASGEQIVTAPTCGAAGVVPAVLYYYQQKNKYSDEQIINALITAGLVGNIIKTNASISGAECGCQAEIGSACAMAAAALAELFELSIDKIEYAAEIAIEHHLGLTCDPICGLVQIPCIERNAVAAMRAIDAVSLASFLWSTRKISFDKVVETMKMTGMDIHSSYKETAEGGLAKIRID